MGANQTHNDPPAPLGPDAKDVGLNLPSPMNRATGRIVSLLEQAL
jgi:hypothetical protein